MREQLAVAVAQPLCVSRDVSANAIAHAAAVQAADSRVVVFPELSLTGYELDVEPIALSDRRLQPLISACAASRAIALAGAPVREDDRLHVAILAIDGFGARIAYRKMWLGGEEVQGFTPGREPSVLSIDGWRLGLAICRDTGIPQHASDTAALGIDCYVAGVLETLDDVFVVSERARRVALGHRIYVATSSFAGSTGSGYDSAAGGSGIWAPDGTVMAEVGSDPGQMARATLT